MVIGVNGKSETLKTHKYYDLDEKFTFGLSFGTITSTDDVDASDKYTMVGAHCGDTYREVGTAVSHYNVGI